MPLGRVVAVIHHMSQGVGVACQIAQGIEGILCGVLISWYGTVDGQGFYLALISIVKGIAVGPGTAVAIRTVGCCLLRCVGFRTTDEAVVLVAVVGRFNRVRAFQRGD